MVDSYGAIESSWIKLKARKKMGVKSRDTVTTGVESRDMITTGVENCKSESNGSKDGFQQQHREQPS